MSAIKVAIGIVAAGVGGPVRAIVSDRYGPYPLAPAVALPQVSFQLVSQLDVRVLKGSARWYDSRVTAHCYAASAGAVDALGETVIGALGDFKGIVAGFDVNTRLAGSDYSDFASDFSLFRRQIDFMVQWRAA